ncbi:MAG: hypothetical protein KGZ34_07990 [Nitrosarchaeum sp.]|nr:hypothetical protein [Nitrosarchaeum sp.]
MFDVPYRNQSKITRQSWQQRKKQQQKNQQQRKSNNIRYFLSYIFFILISYSKNHKIDPVTGLSERHGLENLLQGNALKTPDFDLII